MRYLPSLFLIALTACAHFHPTLPEPELPIAWKELVPTDGYFEEKNRFWELFNDPLLNELEEEAIAQNLDLQAAYYRIFAARSQVMREHSNRLPQIGLSSLFTDNETLLNPPSFGSPIKKLTRVEQQQYSLFADFSYELDLWGKLKSREESAFYDMQASLWEYDFVYQTIVTEIALHYFRLRTIEEEIRFLRQAVAIRRDAVGINQCRVEGGLDPEVDLTRSELELALAEGSLEQAKREYALYEHSLATLLGKPASCWSLAQGRLPETIPSLPEVLPSEILIRRADIQKSWAVVAAGRANVDAELKNYFPSFSLTTALGLASPFVTNLFQWQARYWEYAFAAIFPLFDGGRRDANVLLAKTQFLENFNTYKKTINLAFQDVEDALSTLHHTGLQYEAQKRALEAATDTSYLAKDQFDTGLISYLLVADAEKTVLDVERRAILLKGEKILAWVRLIKALGVQRVPLEDS